jgi:hypothetical protein
MAAKRVAAFNSVPAVAVSAQPLTLADCRAVERLLEQVDGDWTVELTGVRAEDATLVVLPEDGDDTNGPSFVLSREAGGFRIDQLHWDTLTEVGTYATLSDAFASLRAQLAFCAFTYVPASVTIH